MFPVITRQRLHDQLLFLETLHRRANLDLPAYPGRQWPGFLRIVDPSLAT